MRKLSAILVALVLVAATAITAFAAGINSNEQAVLDELKTSVKMTGGEMVIPAEYVNQAENYFNTIEMTEAESKEIIAIIKEGEKYLENAGASNILTLTFDQKKAVLDYGKKVVGVIGMTMTYDKTTQTLTITDPNGKVAFAAKPYLVPAGSGASSGTLANGDTIKPTGAEADFGGIIAVGAVMLLIVAGGAIYLVKRERA